MQKHVHIGMFSDPRTAAAAHDAVLVIAGSPPINCSDAEYVRALGDLCAGKTIESFVEDIRYAKRKYGKRSDKKTCGDGAQRVPPCTMRKELHALADTFMHDRGKPPPTVHRLPRKRARIAEAPPTSNPESDADTPKHAPEHRASRSPPPKKQLVKTRNSDTEGGAGRVKRPRSARVAARLGEDRFFEAADGVQAALAPAEFVSWPSFPSHVNIVSDILFAPDMQEDEHIRRWRHALARLHLERFVDSAYAFS
jgi:hypothetical protein